VTATLQNRPVEPAAEQQQPQQQQQAQQQAQQQPMNTLSPQPPYAVAQHTPSPGTDPQNVPRISNLINPPQAEGTAGYQQHQGGQYVPYTSNNGGTAPAQPQKQQQQQQPQAQQPQQQAQAQAQAQVVVAAQGEARVTKGKYSLADFELLRTLGTGSFGRVHLVQSRHNHRFYAIKVLKKAQVVKMKQIEHTNDERKMLGEVKHPFLITLWGTFQDPRNLYMVMDFVEGGELFSLLRRSGVSCGWDGPRGRANGWHGLTDTAALPESRGQVLRCRSHSGS
jgi:protein kinase A